MKNIRSPLTRIAKVRLYPKAHQIVELEKILDMCYHLYHCGLEERKNAYQKYKLLGKPKDFSWPTLKSQTKEFVESRKEIDWLDGLYSEVGRDVFRKVDTVISAFLGRVSRGETPGYPRRKNYSRYDTFSYPHGNRAIHIHSERKLKFPKPIGFMSYKKSGRVLPTDYGVIRITRSLGKWYACFEHVIELQILTPINKEVGIDVGTISFATYSDRTKIDNPRWNRNANIEFHQQNISQKKKGSKRRKKAVILLAEVRKKEQNSRRDFQHKVSREIVKNYDKIAFEKLKIKNMSKSAKGSIEKPRTMVKQKAGLNRSILDAGLGQLLVLIREKAWRANKELVFVNAAYTSQTCGYVDKKNRQSQAEFECLRCNFIEDADINAAINIRNRAWLRPAKVKDLREFA